MMGSAEWREMIEQEIKELQRLIDRKAENKQIAKFKIAYESRRKSIFKKTPDQNNSTSSASNSPSKQDNDFNKSILKEELNIINSSPSKDSLQATYHFGHDLRNDFTTIFGAFNRVAKQKLDKTVLSDFANVKYIDSLYEKKSIEFSSQLTDSYHLYYRLFDEKITNLSTRISDFNQTVINRLNEIDSLTKNLQKRLNRLFVARRKNNEEEENDEVFDIDANEAIENEELQTSRSESRLLPSSRSSKLELNIDSKKKFAKTIVIRRTPLITHFDD